MARVISIMALIKMNSMVYVEKDKHLDGSVTVYDTLADRQYDFHVLEDRGGLGVGTCRFNLQADAPSPSDLDDARRVAVAGARKRKIIP